MEGTIMINWIEKYFDDSERNDTRTKKECIKIKRYDLDVENNENKKKEKALARYLANALLDDKLMQETHLAYYIFQLWQYSHKQSNKDKEIIDKYNLKEFYAIGINTRLNSTNNTTNVVKGKENG